MSSLFLRYAALSDVGRVRKDNQDSGYVGPNLLVVADGVGGAARGDIASSATVEAIRKLDVPPGNDPLSELAATLHLAHDRLSEIVEAHPDLDGTSTTVTAALFDGTHLQIGHVGDSRGYLLRDGVIEQLTTDHTLVQSLVDEGRITEEEARVHPHRNLILRAVDGVHEPEPDLFSIPVQAGDRLLFCSDGCAGSLTDPELAALLVGDSLEGVAAKLVTSALDAGSSDNVTVVIAELVEDQAAASTAPLVVGAAAVSPHLQIHNEATGNLSESDSARLADVEDDEADVDPEAIRYAPQPPRRGTFLRVLLVVVVVLGLLGGAGWGAYAYSQNHYYVADVDGSVAIYQGINIDLPVGPELNHQKEVSSLRISDLAEYDQALVNNHKSFDNYAKAKNFVAQLIIKNCKGDTAVATDTVTAPAKPKNRRTQSAKPSSKKTASANPTRSPTKAPTKAAATGKPTGTATSTPTTPPTPSGCSEVQ